MSAAPFVRRRQFSHARRALLRCPQFLAAWALLGGAVFCSIVQRSAAQEEGQADVPVGGGGPAGAASDAPGNVGGPGVDESSPAEPASADGRGGVHEAAPSSAGSPDSQGVAAAAGPAETPAASAVSTDASQAVSPVAPLGATSADRSTGPPPASQAAPQAASPAQPQAVPRVEPQAAAPAAVPPAAALNDAVSSGELSRLRADNDAKSKALADLQSESARLKDAAAQASQLAQENERLTQRNSEQEARLGENSKQLEYLKQDAETLKQQNQQLQGAVQQHEASLKEKYGEIEFWKSTVADKDRQISEKDGQLGQVQKSMDDTMSEAAGLKSQLATQTASHVALTRRYHALERQYADPSVQHFLTRKAIKVYNNPGISGASNKTFTYVVPSLLKGQQQGQAFINSSQAMLFSKLNAYVDDTAVEPWLPLLTGFLVYGMVLFPLLCTMWCLTRVICKVRPCLLFLHLYFGLSTFCAGIFSIYTGTDTLRVFAVHDAPVYLVAQACIAVSLVPYFVFLCLACTCSRKGSGEFCYRAVQVILLVVTVTGYYSLVFTPAMLDHQPTVYQFLIKLLGPKNAHSFVWSPYMVAAAIFFTMLRLEQLSWRERGPALPDPKGKRTVTAPQITLREDGELRGVVELATLIGNQDDPELGEKEC